MTEKNVAIMDKIVDEMIGGKPLSEALQVVYVKRNVAIPFDDELFDISIEALNLPTAAFNALMRKRLETVNDVLEYSQNNSLLKIKGFGKNSGIKFIESVLDYAWDNMNKQQRADFLINTVERNEGNLREELM